MELRIERVGLQHFRQIENYLVGLLSILDNHHEKTTFIGFCYRGPK